MRFASVVSPCQQVGQVLRIAQSARVERDIPGNLAGGARSCPERIAAEAAGSQGGDSRLIRSAGTSLVDKEELGKSCRQVEAGEGPPSV